MMRKKKLRSLTVFLAACTVVLCAPSTASATDTTTPPDGGGTDASGKIIMNCKCAVLD